MQIKKSNLGETIATMELIIENKCDRLASTMQRAQEIALFALSRVIALCPWISCQAPTTFIKNRTSSQAMCVITTTVSKHKSKHHRIGIELAYLYKKLRI